MIKSYTCAHADLFVLIDSVFVVGVDLWVSHLHTMMLVTHVPVPVGLLEDGSLAVTACQSFNYQLGLGSLFFMHQWGFVLMNGMTLPVILMFLALPVRL